MSARDELAELIRETGLRAIGRHAIDRAADRIYAAGWVSPAEVARIKAEALREAADALADLHEGEHARRSDGYSKPWNPHDAGWLDGLERGEDLIRARAEQAGGEAHAS